MADEKQKLGLDAADMIAELAKVQSAFATHNAAINQAADTYVKFTKKGEDLKGTFRTVTEDGQKLSGVFQMVADKLSVQTRRIEATDRALKSLVATQKAAALEAARGVTTDFLKGKDIGGPVPDKNLAAVQRAQQRLVAAFALDSKNAGAIATEIFADLEKGIVRTEVGIREKIQKALIGVRDLQRSITREIEKQAKLNAPAAPATPSPRFGTERINQLRAGIAGQFAVPTNANINAVISYQQALSSLIAVAARGKVEFSRVVELFNQVSRNPTRSFAANFEEQKIETAAQRVIAAQRGIIASSKALEKSNESLTISFNQFLKILEVQLVHRAFGALLTGMQQSVVTAARLQVSISEIRTVAQASGISFQELQTRIRAVSEEFNRPQVDVAEALYQGFSNQVIKTAADLNVLNEAMRLSRITASSAANGMEALSSVLNAYRTGTVAARDISNELFKAVEIGRFRLDEVASSLGRVTVVGAQVGVSRQEILGLLAGLTRNGVPAAEAMTQISGIMQALLKPSEEMTRLFRQMGVSSGFAAVQTFGFTNVLQRLFAEAQKGNADLAASFQNVRAFRGVLGGTAGGGTGELAGDISAIRNAQESADRAFAIMSESAGDRFLKEMEKIRNFFINDFANSFIATVERMAKPFGGISNAVKSFGNTIVAVTGLISNFVNNVVSIITLNGSYTISIGKLVAAYLLWKGTLIALAVAQGIVATANAALAATRLALAASAAAVVAGEAGIAATMGLATFAIYSQISAWIALRLAMLATPFGIFVAVATVTAALATWVAHLLSARKAFKDLEGDIERINAAADQVGVRFERNNEAISRVEARERAIFEGDLEARSQAINRVLAHIRRKSEEIGAVQREMVRNTTSNLKLAIDAVGSAMSNIVSELTRKINESKTEIENSVRHVGSFADREASRRFQTALRLAGAQPEIITGLRPLSPEDAQNERITRQARLNSLTNQQVLIQDRIAELTREAQEASQRGDVESIASARRKFEEIRRLTEQLFESQSEQEKQVTTNRAVDLARQTGRTITAAYEVNQERLRAMMEAVRRQEEQAEAAYQARRARIQADAERDKAAQEARNREFLEAQRRLGELSLTNAQGEVKPEFRGAQGAREFQRQFDEQANKLRQLAQQSGLSIGERMALENAISQQRIALGQQTARQIADFEIEQIGRRVAAETAAVRELETRAANERNQGRGALATGVPEIIRQTGEMQRAIDELTRLVPARNAAAVEQATRSYERQREVVIATARELAEAPDAQKEEIARRLQDETRFLSDIYRRVLLAVGQRRPEGGGGRTGQEIAALPTRAENVADQVVENAAKLTNAARLLEEATRRNAALLTQIQALPPALRDAALGFDGLGVRAEGQAQGINTLAQGIAALNAQFNALRAQQPITLPRVQQPPGQAAPAGVNPNVIQGFAAGGLIGGKFTGRGPDNRVIFARDGEMVINSASTRKFYSQLVAINSGRPPRGYASGGVVTNNRYGDINITVDGSRSPSVSARAIMKELKREKRRGTGG